MQELDYITRIRDTVQTLKNAYDLQMLKVLTDDEFNALCKVSKAYLRASLGLS